MWSLPMGALVSLCESMLSRSWKLAQLSHMWSVSCKLTPPLSSPLMLAHGVPCRASHLSLLLMCLGGGGCRHLCLQNYRRIGPPSGVEAQPGEVHGAACRDTAPPQHPCIYGGGIRWVGLTNFMYALLFQQPIIWSWTSKAPFPAASDTKPMQTPCRDRPVVSSPAISKHCCRWGQQTKWDWHQETIEAIGDKGQWNKKMYIVRSYRVVIVVTSIATRRTNKAYSIVMY